MKYILPGIVTLVVIALLMSQNNYVFAQTTLDYGGSTMTITPHQGICVDGECKWVPEFAWDIDFEIQVNDPSGDGIWFWIANWDDNITIESFPSFCIESPDPVVRLFCEKLDVSSGDVITGKIKVNPPEGTEYVCGAFSLGVLSSTGSIVGGNDSETICKGVRTEPIETDCLIATASYGSSLAPQVQMLREIRDNHLLQTASGSAFMTQFNTYYYTFAPTIAQWENENPTFKEVVKITITPLISSLSLLNYVEMDSEFEVLGYGISMILLNIGMYFIAPAIVMIGLKRKLTKL